MKAQTIRGIIAVIVATVMTISAGVAMAALRGPTLPTPHPQTTIAFRSTLPGPTALPGHVVDEVERRTIPT